MLRLSARRFLGITRIPGCRMSSESGKPYKSHEERTATEPRDPDLVDVTIDHVQPVHSTVRLFKLGLVDRQRGLKVSQWPHNIFKISHSHPKIPSTVQSWLLA